MSHDIDGNSEINLTEFSTIMEHLAPGKYKERKCRKMFLHLYEMVVPSDEGGVDDKNRRGSVHIEKAVGIPEVAAFCLALGIFAPREHK